MGVAHLLHVGNQPLGQLAIRQVAVAIVGALFGDPRPRAEVHLVDRHRTLEPRPGVHAAVHPLRVAPLVRRAADDRRRQRRHLELEPERIRLDDDLAVLRAQLELVAVADGGGRDEDLPDAAHAEQAHGVHAPVPAVEVADDAGAGGVGGPDGEVHALGGADRHRVRAELVVDAGVVALAEEVEVVVGDDAAVSIRIVHVDGVAAGIRHAQAIVEVDAGVRRIRKRRFVDAGRMAPRHRHQRQAIAHDGDGFGRGQAGADRQVPALEVRAEHRERIGVAGAGDGVENELSSCAVHADIIVRPAGRRPSAPSR